MAIASARFIVTYLLLSDLPIWMRKSRRGVQGLPASPVAGTSYAVPARTRHVRLGTGLTCPILRYHPAVVAQAAANVSRLAPGRAYLAVGTGEALNEYSATGM